MPTSDFLVIGGGIIGVSIARELQRCFTDSSVTVLEKEATSDRHASGRNSGVLHAGFYYTPDSLKAQFTKTGNALLTAYCEAKHLPLNRCGKLVVAKDVHDHAAMDILLARGRANAIVLEDISERQAKEIEPRVKTCERALFSPTTSTVDPVKVLHAIVDDAQREGITIHYQTRYEKKTEGKTIQTSHGTYDAGYVVNAAGLYADVIAREFGFSDRYQILPFKGLYLYSDEPAGAFRTNIYPVPDLKNPFLGVHVTVNVEGRSKIGPTAIPAFWREQYHGIDNFNITELLDLLKRQTGLLVSSNFDFTRLAFHELRKYSRPHLIRLASSLAHKISIDAYTQWGRPGIRAQLIDVTQGKLEMDFVLEGDRTSMHVLNAVSPGFTCAIPFSSYVCEKIEQVLAS
ncbi:MAG: aminobutyraldehyde dehydrogenase [Nitrospirales bacterium]|nr:MAG: aminobutyraldehyde dehydrogenase [Nitrospirales bacterium]